MYTKDFLFDFTKRVFMKMGCSETDAVIIADVFLAAELRGHASHGMIRIKDYFELWHAGRINVKPQVKVVHESPCTAVVDGDNAVGMIAARRSMEIAIGKARSAGTGWVATRNSNHFGIAAYYAMQALPHGMIGVWLTNSQPLIAPTYGRERILGTNPISVAVPAGGKRPYVLDMATSIVPMGKIMLAETKGQKVPLGYGIDGDGNLTEDPKAIRYGGALLPLGGTDIMSGYKGYGLALLVDILCGVLSGAAFGADVGSPVATSGDPTNIGHFFMAVDIGAFRSPGDFGRDMDTLIGQLAGAAKEPGRDRIYIHGEKEFETRDFYLKNGIGLPEAVVEVLKAKGEETGVPFDVKPVS